ncbi:hypothetical protein CFP56_001490 [Quercus suber]|uniref:Uncharacterized protein n=1 Tax=Quercus suber TaxID=58331 RepID=A0AAW0LF99_QUESU
MSSANGQRFRISQMRKQKSSGSMPPTMTPPTCQVVKMMKKCQLFKTE